MRKLWIVVVALVAALVPGTAAAALDAEAEVTVERNTVEASPETNTDVKVESVEAGNNNSVAANNTQAEVGSGNTATVGGDNQVNPETNTEVSPATTVNAPVGVNAPVTATDVVDVNGNRILTNESSTTTTTDNSDHSVRNRVETNYIEGSFNQGDGDAEEDYIYLDSETRTIKDRRGLAFDVSGKTLPKTGFEEAGSLLLLGLYLVASGKVLTMMGRRQPVWCR